LFFDLSAFWRVFLCISITHPVNTEVDLYKSNHTTTAALGSGCIIVWNCIIYPERTLRTSRSPWARPWLAYSWNGKGGMGGSWEFWEKLFGNSPLLLMVTSRL
jgi:hypothetical protein